MNTEIGKTGEVIVEGHVIGRLDGFTFAPDAAEAGSDAKALQATAQKALAGEIDARAEKLAAAPDDQFVLTSDGTIRWTGDAVAKLVAADDALHPRLRIISDDRLTGAPREAVQTRLDLWLKTHIEKLLGPLFDLAKAEDITGIARGIAFQLIEALGVLERAKIAAEMKDLDQPSRATLAQIRRALRRLSHLFPGAAEARGARAGLAAVGAEAGQCRYVGAVGRAASGVAAAAPRSRSTRRSPRDAYRVLGYRQCGERAVRVDILERLADLIRPALAWRESFARRKARRRVRWPRLCGDAGDDLADRFGRRGFRLDPARARLSHGEAARRCRRSRWRPTRASGAKPRLPKLRPQKRCRDAVGSRASEARSQKRPSSQRDAGRSCRRRSLAQPVSGDPAPSAALLPEVTLAPPPPKSRAAAVEAAPERRAGGRSAASRQRGGCRSA